MKPRRLQLSRRHRGALFMVGMLLFVSGLVWSWANRLDELGRAGEEWRQLKPWCLKIHGMSAVVLVFLFGTLLASHVRRAWHARKNRLNGAFFGIFLSLLTVSGYLLYYLGDESWRSAASSFHFWLGTVSPGLLLWHILSGRRDTQAKWHLDS